MSPPRISVAMNGACRTQGGMFHSIRRLWQAAHRGGADVVVHALQADTPESREDAGVYAPLDLRLHRPTSRVPFERNTAMREALEAARGRVISLHGLWLYSSYAALRGAEVSGAPLVVHPHGMMEPWALRNSALKKRIVSLLWHDRLLGRTACFRALTDEERGHIRAAGCRAPVAVIPNGIEPRDYEDLPPREELGRLFPALEGQRRVLFLGRIHPKKGIPHLLRAWSSLRHAREGWALIVAGPDEGGHLAEVSALSRSLGIEASVHFPGPLFGEAKRAALAGSDFFVLPSFSEGFSVAVLEASICGLPSLITPQCYFPALVAAGGAMLAEPEEASTARGLEALMTAGDDARRAMGRSAHDLVVRDYSWDRIGGEMNAVCSWLLGEGDKPGCVDG